jgi:conjugative relaxase-like TrwC/TraI family protein
MVIDTHIFFTVISTVLKWMIFGTRSWNPIVSQDSNLRMNRLDKLGQTRSLQPQELFASQRYATNVYRSDLAVRLNDLGYKVERGEWGEPQIAGYSKEYLAANSLRREQVKDYIRANGIDGPAAAQIAAHRTRDPKPPQRELAEAPKQEKSQDLDVGLSL